MAGAIFIPVAYLHFITVFLNYKKKLLLIISYSLGLVFLCFDFTNLFVAKVETVYSFTFWPKPGIMYHPFLILWLACLAYTVYLLFKEYKTAKDIKKIQIKYLIIGTFIGYGGGITNYLYWYNIPVPPIGNILASAYILITAYAITRYRFMDIRVVLKKSVFHLITFCGIAGVIISLVLLLNRYFSTKNYNINDIVIIEVVLLIIFLPILNKIILRITNKYINKEEIDLSKHIEEFNTNISYTTYLKDLLEQCIDFIKERLKIEKVDIIVRDFSIPDLGYFYPTAGKKVLDKETQELFLEYFKEDRSLLLKQEIPYISVNKENADILGRMNKFMQKENITAIAGLTQVDAINGFILIGPKNNNDIFSEKENILLKNTSKQINSALARVLCYEEAVARVKREFGNKSNTP
jgi:hypothetical protein